MNTGVHSVQGGLSVAGVPAGRDPAAARLVLPRDDDARARIGAGCEFGALNECGMLQVGIFNYGGTFQIGLINCGDNYQLGLLNIDGIASLGLFNCGKKTHFTFLVGW